LPWGAKPQGGGQDEPVGRVGVGEVQVGGLEGHPPTRKASSSQRRGSRVKVSCPFRAGTAISREAMAGM